MTTYGQIWGDIFKGLDRVTVGYDKTLDRLFEIQSNHRTSNYPPYNISRSDQNLYKIEMAVAGFDPMDIDVTVQGEKLVVSGSVRSDSKTYPEYLFRGLSFRDFVHTFTLGENVEITGASVLNGMLTIDLEHRVPEAQQPKKIEIKTQASGDTASLLTEDSE